MIRITNTNNLPLSNWQLARINYYENSPNTLEAKRNKEMGVIHMRNQNNNETFKAKLTEVKDGIYYFNLHEL